MAEVFPTSRVNVPSDVDQLISFLCALPSGWKIFVGWPEIGHLSPDVLVVGPRGHAAYLSATGAAAPILDKWSSTDVLDATAPLPLRRLDRAVRSLARRDLGNVQRWLVLTRARELPLYLHSQLPQDVRPVILDHLQVTSLQKAIEAWSPWSDDTIVQLRAIIGAPSVVAAQMTAARASAENVKLRFLDDDQESWLRRHLAPPPDSDKPFEAQAGAYMITGVAGCGKTLLLLYRATLERKINPKLRILFLTHNAALTTDLNRRANILGQQLGVTPVQVQRFYQWCKQWATPWPLAKEYSERENIIRRCLDLTEEATVKFLADEFAWISDEGLKIHREYLEVERRGRVRGLPIQDRPRVWEAYLRYKRALGQMGGVDQKVTDWPGIADHCLKIAEQGRAPMFDLILIDEAQFFSPVAIRVLRQALVSGGRLVLAADPTQGFLQRRSPWSSAGLDFRGRSTRLRRAYRSTRQILEYAKKFYLSRQTNDGSSEINLPHDTELETAAVGTDPEVLEVPLQQDEHRAALEAVDALIQLKIAPNDILILHDLRQPIPTQGNGWYSVPAKAATRGNAVRTSTFETATGLEAPYVVITGLRQLFEREANPVLASERLQIMLDNTRKIYMALTRAGHKVLLIWSGSNRPEWM